MPSRFQELCLSTNFAREASKYLLATPGWWQSSQNEENIYLLSFPGMEKKKTNSFAYIKLQWLNSLWRNFLGDRPTNSFSLN